MVQRTHTVVNLGDKLFDFLYGLDMWDHNSGGTGVERSGQTHFIFLGNAYYDCGAAFRMVLNGMYSAASRFSKPKN